MRHRINKVLNAIVFLIKCMLNVNILPWDVEDGVGEEFMGYHQGALQGGQLEHTPWQQALSKHPQYCILYTVEQDFCLQ